MKTLFLICLAVTMTVASASAQGGPGPIPFPQAGPPENPTTPEKAVLGKILFWEEQLSADNTVACGTCHRPEFGGTDPRFAVHPGPDGVFGQANDVIGSFGLLRSDADNDYLPDPVFFLFKQVTGRRSPTNIGVQAAAELFWDGRAGGTFTDPVSGTVVIAAGGALESQAVGPPVSSVEMAHDARDWTEIVEKLEDATPMKLASNLTPDIIGALAMHPTYPDLFDSAFGSPDISAVRIAFALAAYQRTLVPNQAPFDAFVAGNPAALTPNQAQGLAVFNGPGRCDLCHSGPAFTDHDFHTLGVRPPAEDSGRQVVTMAAADLASFKTPNLRNVGLRPRFMHEGSFNNINQVIGFYNGGGGNPVNRDPLLIPLGLNPGQINSLADFLVNGLTDPRLAAGLPPFDRPTLHDEVIPTNPRLFGIGSAGSGGFVPAMLALTPPSINNEDWKLGMTVGLGGGQAFLGLAYDDAPPGTLVNGVPIFIDADPGEQFLFPIALDGALGVPGAGFTTVRLPIADNPFLIGLSLYFQWFVLDPAAVGTVASSRAAELTFF